MGIIVNLTKYRRARHSANGMGSTSTAQKIPSCNDLENYINYQWQFNIDLANIKYKTRSHRFMFPSILCSYKRNINPVCALYNITQEAQVYCDQSNTLHAWVLNLYNDPAWLCALISAVDADILAISKLVRQYSNTTSPYIQKKILELSNQAERFSHYRSIFSNINTWKLDNL